MGIEETRESIGTVGLKSGVDGVGRGRFELTPLSVRATTPLVKTAFHVKENALFSTPSLMFQPKRVIYFSFHILK